MIKYGVKIWSINEYYFTEAVSLYKNNDIDFVELYIVPHRISESVRTLKKVKIQIHAPYSGHKFNIFQLNQEKINFFQEQVIKTADMFNANNIILHAGVGVDEQIFQKNIKLIADNRILIENKPKVGLNSEICFGYSFDQLFFIKNKCGLEICLDFTHAIKSAFSQKINYKIFLDKLIKYLEPSYFHITGTLVKGDKDKHLNIWEGDADMGWIKNKLNGISQKKDIHLVFEVPKNKRNLSNDLKNILYFKNLSIGKVSKV